MKPSTVPLPNSTDTPPSRASYELDFLLLYLALFLQPTSSQNSELINVRDDPVSKITSKVSSDAPSATYPVK